MFCTVRPFSVWLRTGLFIMLAATFVFPLSLAAQSSTQVATPSTCRSIDVVPLLRIEQRELPECVVDGPARFSNLPDYYWAENTPLQQRFEGLRRDYESKTPRPRRAITLVAGAAGIGKTFFKNEIFRKDYPREAVCKFDIRELYNEWQNDGTVVMKPDLSFGHSVINSLPSLANPESTRLTEYLTSRDAAFYVIDSLDELHPDDYASVLQQVEDFVFHTEKPFVHLVIFARPLAFVDFWQRRTRPYASAGEQDLALFTLQPPRFRTTGDLLVSSWNYHNYEYKLTWSPNGDEPQPMPLDVYARWVEAGFLRAGPFASVQAAANQSMRTDVHFALLEWAEQHRIVGSMLYNLAGNSILRQIVEAHVIENRPYDERIVMEEYLSAWLERDTKSDNRPSIASPQYLDLYLRLLEEIAVRPLSEGRIDQQGYFVVQPDETVRVRYEDQDCDFSVRRVLHRSGLKHIDLLAPDGPKYRFEPLWFHRLLVEHFNERSHR